MSTRWMVGAATILLAAACATPGPSRAEDGQATLGVGQPMQVGDHPLAVAASEDAVWVTHVNEGTVVRIDPTSRKAVATISVSDEGLAAERPIALGEDAVWVVSGGLANEVRGVSPQGVSYYNVGGLVRIDPDTNEVVARIPTGVTRGSVVIANEDAWIANAEDGIVTQVDGETNEVVATIDVAGRVINGLAFAEGSLWTIVECRRSLMHLTDAGLDEPCNRVSLARIDPRARTVAEMIPLDLDPEAAVGGLIGSDDALWTATFRLPEPGQAQRGMFTSLLRIDLGRAGAIEEVATGRTPLVATVGAGVVWATDCLAGTVDRIDPATNQVVGEPLLVGTPAPPDVDVEQEEEDFSCPASAALAGDTLWVVLSGDDAVVPVAIG
jgi:DNA-binding beta-propeller fold protein YncE